MNPKIIPIHANQNDSATVVAKVKGLSENGVMIDCSGSVICAHKAFSCLVTPMPGDRVLVSQADTEYFVLAILERPDQQAMSLDFPSSVQFSSPEGGMTIAARDNIDLVTPASSNITAGDIQISASSMQLQSEKMVARSQDIEAHTRNLHVFTELLNTVAERVTQRANMVVRWVEGVETLNIGNLIQKVRHNHTSHANQAVITAKSDMRIDAERIHMG